MSDVVVTVTEVIANNVVVTSVEVVNAIIVSEETTVVNTSNQLVGTASNIPCEPIDTLSVTNVQEALHQLADKHFIQIVEPSSGDVNLNEGDVWYDVGNGRLKVYQNTQWEDLILSAQLSEGADTNTYPDIELDGGVF